MYSRKSGPFQTELPQTTIKSVETDGYEMIAGLLTPRLVDMGTFLSQAFF